MSEPWQQVCLWTFRKSQAPGKLPRPELKRLHVAEPIATLKETRVASSETNDQFYDELTGSTGTHTYWAIQMQDWALIAILVGSRGIWKLNENGQRPLEFCTTSVSESHMSRSSPFTRYHGGTLDLATGTNWIWSSPNSSTSKTLWSLGATTVLTATRVAPWYAAKSHSSRKRGSSPSKRATANLDCPSL